MTTCERPNDLEFGGPAIYRIVVQGRVSENWRKRLGGMEVATSAVDSGRPCTTLLGRIHDQAALHGLLDTLYALHLPILEVSKVDS